MTKYKINKYKSFPQVKINNILVKYMKKIDKIKYYYLLL